MPSHNGVNIDNALFQSAKFDFTELSFSDNLNCPSADILKAEQLMASCYNAKKSLFFTAGATSAIFSAIGAIKTTTKKVAVDLFSHKSVFQALRFFGLEAVVIQRKFDSEGLPQPLTQNDIVSVFEKNDGIGAVLLTSPDYFGMSLNFEQISKITKQHNALLMVDEAQGAHFVFSKLFPQSANQFADLVVNSLHKTLPVYTGGAILNVHCDLSAQTTLYRAMLHTSSPSYVTMASMDYARDLFQSDGEKMFAKVKNDIEKLIRENQNYTFKFLNDPLHDFTRLVINVDSEQLEKHGVYAEMSWGNWSVLIVSPFNADKLPILSKVLQKLSPQNSVRDFGLDKLQFLDILPKFDTNSNFEFVDFENCLGRISGVDIGAYPPGTPIVFAGEKIEKEKFDFLKNNKNSIFNLVNGQLYVILK